MGTIGSLIGAIIAYEVGRTAGRTIVDRWGKWILLDAQGPGRCGAVVRQVWLGLGAGGARDPGRSQLHLGVRRGWPR